MTIDCVPPTSKTLQGTHYIDLFAGIGGFHLAMDAHQAHCVFASEWDKSAATVYHANFGMTPLGDITKTAASAIPLHEVLCAGFPCQAFSVSGKQQGFNDTRGTLFFDIARIVAYHQPKVVLLENVKHLVKHDHGRTLTVIITTLSELGYDVYYRVLNTSHYGLPQHRERLYMVCFKKQLQVKGFLFPSPIAKPSMLYDCIEPSPNAKIIMRDDIKIQKDFIPPVTLFGDTQWPNKPVQIGTVNKGGQGERIYSPYGHACTLSAYGGGAGAKTGLYLIDGVVRKLSPRECARIQGFPDSFVLDQNQNQSYKQFGNSVSVSVIRAIITQIGQVL
ncbi:DNA (cytosine-5-)-methyltransferase [bacterium]|nr:DNA (cytosine-5-)-methyltransferase [bacterium]